MPNPLTLNHLFWPEPVVILAHTELPDAVTVEAVGVETRRHYTTTLPRPAWDALAPIEQTHTFDAPALQFKLALEAERLRRAYAADPLLAANNSRVHLLPHQMEAVYGVMLPQPRIRHLLAHDAGAGKTIMAGLLYKELASRTPHLRTLIIAPAALTVQWQRELREKFLVEFDIIERQHLRANGQVWLQAARLITSLPFARQADVLATLASVPWDLVIVDEAHHLAGYDSRETQAYRLGCLLAHNTKHLVLATATPHKGDRGNFLKLLQLLDAQIHDPDIVNQRAPGQRGNPLMLRRLKEEMTDFDGNPLFKPRHVQTRWHVIGENPPEMALYAALTDYVHKTYRAAERIGGRVKVNTEFAMVMLQRRMASSFAALERSLAKRRVNVLAQVAVDAPIEVNWDELEEEPEAARWQQEEAAESATPAQTQQEREKEAAQIADLLQKLTAVRASGRETKVEALRKIVAETGITPGNGEKLLVFTEFKDTLDFLRGLFETWGYTVNQIDGSMAHADRRRAEAEFSQHCQVMVATEAAGEGINLQFCAYLVNYDLPWVPTRLEQRMGRIHRYGQTRVAHIFNLVAADTREGAVLTGLMDRLAQMRTHLGDQVFDVVSALVSDTTVETLLAHVALAPSNEPAQEVAIQKLAEAIQAGVARYQQWEEHPFAISTAQFQQMQQASRQSRLTPEYAQHFFVDALAELKETPLAFEAADTPAGDAEVISLTLQRTIIARELQLPAKRRLLFTFHAEPEQTPEPRHFLALGAPVFERLLTLVEARWGATLQRGAAFMDADLAPGASYLLWFLAAQVRDGLDQTVDETLFAIKQSMDGCAPAPAASLIDLIPAPDTCELPPALLAWAGDSHAALTWSMVQQQLPFLRAVQERRRLITQLRQGPLLHDAQAAVAAADAAYNEMVFAVTDESDLLRQAETEREQAQARIGALQWQFAHEAACALGPTRVMGVAAVLALQEPPQHDMEDERPPMGQAAQALARTYEEKHGRQVKDVSGAYNDYPYDLHSSGPGGVRCIEVKATTSGRILLSENQRRAAHRLGKAYYLYIVTDPLGAHPGLTIVRDPLGKMNYDDVLYSGARYLFDAKTWQAAADEETTL